MRGMIALALSSPNFFDGGCDALSTSGSWLVVDQFFIPQGTIIDSASTFPSATDPAFSSKLETYRWSQLVVGLNPPINAQPLDQATFDAMKAIYPSHRHLIVTVPGADGIVR